MVEISPEVLELAPHFEAVNFGLPGRAPEGVDTEVVVDDGRAFLRRTERRFDVITLEPLLPGTPAAIHFYTRDFFQLARDRLDEQGVLCHWIPLHGQPSSSFRAILRAFVEVFPETDVYVFGHSAVLLGWNDPRPALPVEQLQRRVESVYEDLRQADVHRPEDVLAGFVTDGGLLAGGTEDAAPVTDDRPRILYATIRPNHELFRYHAESLTFLLGLARDGPPDGLTAVSDVFRANLVAAQQQALANQWDLARRQEVEFETRRRIQEQFQKGESP